MQSPNASPNPPGGPDAAALAALEAARAQREYDLYLRDVAIGQGNTAEAAARTQAANTAYNIHSVKEKVPFQVLQNLPDGALIEIPLSLQARFGGAWVRAIHARHYPNLIMAVAEHPEAGIIDAPGSPMGTLAEHMLRPTILAQQRREAFNLHHLLNERAARLRNTEASHHRMLTENQHYFIIACDEAEELMATDPTLQERLSDAFITYGAEASATLSSAANYAANAVNAMYREVLPMFGQHEQRVLSDIATDLQIALQGTYPDVQIIHKALENLSQAFPRIGSEYVLDKLPFARTILAKNAMDVVELHAGQGDYQKALAIINTFSDYGLINEDVRGALVSVADDALKVWAVGPGRSILERRGEMTVRTRGMNSEVRASLSIILDRMTVLEMMGQLNSNTYNPAADWPSIEDLLRKMHSTHDAYVFTQYYQPIIAAEEDDATSATGSEEIDPALLERAQNLQRTLLNGDMRIELPALVAYLQKIDTLHKAHAGVKEESRIERLILQQVFVEGDPSSEAHKKMTPDERQKAELFSKITLYLREKKNKGWSNL